MGGNFEDFIDFHSLGQLYGHTHGDDFHLQILDAKDEEASTKSFILMAPSISPVYSNNPAFRVLSLNTNKQALVDYDQYYLDLVIATGKTILIFYTFSYGLRLIFPFVSECALVEITNSETTCICITY